MVYVCLVAFMNVASSLRLIWLRTLVGATCNGWAAKYLFVVVDIPCMYWLDRQGSATKGNAYMQQNILIYELHTRYQRCGN
jgi:hypothetical protein